MTPCPKCGSHILATERTPDGDTECVDCSFRCKTSHWNEIIWELQATVEHQRVTIARLQDEIGKMRR